MKAQKKELFRDEIHDHIHDKIDFQEFLKLIEDLISKDVLKTTSDNNHYDLN